MNWLKSSYSGIALGAIIGIVIMSFFIDSCKRGGVVTDTVTVEIVKYDTVYPDTIFRSVPVAVNPGRLTNVRDTFIFDTIKTLANLKIRSYDRYYEDSAVDIRAKVKVFGELKGLSINYRYKLPTINTTRTITKTVRVYEEKRHLYIGAATGIGVERINIDLDYTTKNGWMYGYRYEPMTNSHMIKVGKKIF